MKKLFGGLNITWPKLILFAVICGVYTGIVAMLPVTADTSFRDISTTFEWWILFAILIIVNSKTPLDSALKVFVFFLISQPLVYLVQAPFHPDGLGLLRYYPSWFRWTLLTFPMAFVGWYMKKDKWWSLLILAPMLVFLGYHYVSYFGEAYHFFPQHLLTAIFCAVTMILYPLCIFKDRRLRLIGLALSVLILLAGTVWGIADQRSHTYETDLLLSGGETSGVEFDDAWQARLADESFGTVEFRYVDAIESWAIHASLTNTGDTQLILTAPTGEQYVYDVTVERNSYRIHRRE